MALNITVAFADLLGGAVFRFVQQLDGLLATVLTHIDLLSYFFGFVGIVNPPTDGVIAYLRRSQIADF
jgi:hypothetical protein